MFLCCKDFQHAHIAVTSNSIMFLPEKYVFWVSWLWNQHGRYELINIWLQFKPPYKVTIWGFLIICCWGSINGMLICFRFATCEQSCGSAGSWQHFTSMSTLCATKMCHFLSITLVVSWAKFVNYFYQWK